MFLDETQQGSNANDQTSPQSNTFPGQSPTHGFHPGNRKNLRPSEKTFFLPPRSFIFLRLDQTQGRHDEAAVSGDVGERVLVGWR